MVDDLRKGGPPVGSILAVWMPKEIYHGSIMFVL